MIVLDTDRQNAGHKVEFPSDLCYSVSDTSRIHMQQLTFSPKLMKCSAYSGTKVGYEANECEFITNGFRVREC